MIDNEYFAKLEQAVVDGLKRVRNKTSFWNLPNPLPPGVNQYTWLHEEEILKMIREFNYDTFQDLTDEEKMLLALAWEFVWGQPRPNVITEYRASFMTKNGAGTARDNTQKPNLANAYRIMLWVDTDLF